MQQRNRKSNKNKTQSDKAAAGPIEVKLTDSAAAAYTRFYERAQAALDRGDTGNAHVTVLRQIDDAIEHIIPHDPFNKKHALVGDLKPIFRLHKGRLRICWVGSSGMNEVYVLFISETPRKEGDANDPYEVLSKQVKNGQHDELFKRLGLKSPLRSQTDLIQ